MTRPSNASNNLSGPTTGPPRKGPLSAPPEPNRMHTRQGDPETYSLRKQLKKTIIILLTLFLSAWFILFTGRSLLDSILDRIDAGKAVHHDNTTISSGVTPEVNNTLVFIYTNEDGELKRVAAERDKLTPFVNSRLEFLENRRLELINTVTRSIREDNTKSFQPIYGRIPDYADWYFAYTTTYVLLGTAVQSAVSHAVETRVISLKDAVSIDVERYIEKKFEKIVLKPEVTDPALQQVYLDNLKQAHRRFLQVAAELDTAFQEYIASNTTHFTSPESEQVHMEIDWASAIRKTSTAGYEKGGGGAVVGGLVTTGGMLTGKAVGGAAGKVAAGKALSTGAGKTLMAKMVAPFAAKAISVTGSAAAGGAAGTAVGGPVGAVVGTGIGVLVDYAINEGVELVNRDNFEQDTRLVIDSFATELSRDGAESLEKTVNVWFTDIINLLTSFN